MKLIRFGEFGKEKPGISINNQNFTFDHFDEDYNELFFATNGLERLKISLENADRKLIAIPANVRLGSPIARPSKIVGVGLNYTEHINATGLPTPSEPVIFLKATSALSGANDPIVLPPGSFKTDWETELAVIIEKKASYVSEMEAMNFVAGYSLFNDFSERAFQIERNGTVDKGKGCDSFAPLGPYLVTKDELSNINELSVWFSLNGVKMQHGNTKELIFKIPFLISYISQFMTLLPGDVVATGTPSGTGHRQNPPIYLKVNDVINYGIECLGTASKICERYSFSPAY